MLSPEDKKYLESVLADHKATVNANIKNEVSRTFKEFTDQMRAAQPVIDAVTAPGWFTAFKTSIEEKFDGISKKVETLWVAKPPTPEAPTAEMVSLTTKVKEEAKEAKDWLVRAWLFVTGKVASAYSWSKKQVVSAYHWAKDNVKYAFKEYPATSYLVTCAAIFLAGVYLPGAFGAVSAKLSAWRFKLAHPFIAKAAPYVASLSNAVTTYASSVAAAGITLLSANRFYRWGQEYRTLPAGAVGADFNDAYDQDRKAELITKMAMSLMIGVGTLVRFVPLPAAMAIASLLLGAAAIFHWALTGRPAAGGAGVPAISMAAA